MEKIKECKLDIDEILKQIDTYIEGLGGNNKATKVNILPEVSEKKRFNTLKLSTLDFVNKSELDNEIIQQFKKHKIKLIIPKNKRTIKKNKISVESLEINNKIYILNRKLLKGKLTKTGVSFILSHGGLMENIFRISSGKQINKDSIKNLDVLFISVKGGKYDYIKLFRFPKYSKLLESFEKYKDNKNYFFIRHCKACHNLKYNNEIVKGFKVLKGEMMGKKTRGSLSMCLKEITNSIKKMNILPLFKYLKENNIKYSFNSSIIFRAILTMSLIITHHNNVI